MLKSMQRFLFVNGLMGLKKRPREMAQRVKYLLSKHGNLGLDQQHPCEHQLGGKCLLLGIHQWRQKGPACVAQAVKKNQWAQDPMRDLISKSKVQSNCRGYPVMTFGLYTQTQAHRYEHVHTYTPLTHTHRSGQAWWCTPKISEYGSQREEKQEFSVAEWVYDQPGLHEALSQ